LAAGKAAGVKHHIALSIVGADRLPDSGYLCAKVAQEKIVRESGIPYTIVRSTQFMEFLGGIAQTGTVGATARLSTGYLQPIASDDVAEFVTDAALAAPATASSKSPARARAPVRFRQALPRGHWRFPHDCRRSAGHVLRHQTRSRFAGLRQQPRIGRTGFDLWFATTPRK